MLGTTMTTNNIPFGVPDPDEIARLANAFFAGWPGNAPGGGGVPPAPGGSVATAPAQGVVGDPHGPPTGKDLLVPLESPRIEEAKTPEPASPDKAAPPRTSSLATFDAFAFSPFLAPSPVQPGVRPIGIGSGGLAQDFPILGQRINGHRLIWLDNAATTQKPQCVIDRLSQFYETENSNVHRAAHTLAARATDAYEAAREKVRRFLGAGSTSEIVFVRGATEAINLVAQAWGRANVKAGDEITYDYCLYDGGDDEAICNCGAKNCRGTMYSPEEIKRRKAAARKAAKKAAPAKRGRHKSGSRPPKVGA